MAVKKRTTKPISKELKSLRADLRAADQRGEDPVRPLYKAMSAESKRAFFQTRPS